MRIFYLEMDAPSELIPASMERTLTLEVVEPADGLLNQRFYRDVGTPWNWRGRNSWPEEEWRRYVSDEPVTTAVIREGEEILGYGEMKNDSGDVEITNFGLFLPYIGRGYGGAALVEVVRLAWSLKGSFRVWLHTCERDHPNALNNYQRRGFRLFRTEEEQES